MAKEIRNLADRCAKATGDIAQIVRGLENVTREVTETTTEGARIAADCTQQSATGLAGCSIEDFSGSQRSVYEPGLARERIAPVCLVSRCRSWPVSAAQSRTVLSSLPDATTWPLGDQARLVI